MRTFIIGLSLVLALTQVAAADPPHKTRAQQMAETLAGCKNFMRKDRLLFSYEEGYQEALCIGTISGIREAAEDICVPNRADLDQMILVVVKYIQDRPQRMHEGFPKLAYEALKAAWPCKQ
jgi:hypothetical protein